MPTFSSIISRILRRPSAADIALLQNSKLMDPLWYKSYYYDLRDLKGDPVSHYLRRGAREGRDPGPDFNTSFYLSLYPDVLAAGANPLVHYLRAGMAEGRRPSPDFILATSIENAEITCLKAVELKDEMAIIIAHVRGGTLPRYVEYYLRKLVSNNISIVLVISSNKQFSGVGQELYSQLSGLYVREEDDQDFCAWAHILRLNPEMFKVDALILGNDRFFGPIDDASLSQILARVRASDSDIVGLTDGYSEEWHIEPYFLALKRRLLKSQVFSEYMQDIVSYDEANLSFSNHTIPLMRIILEEKFSSEILFPVEPGRVVNRTVSEWRELIAEGFPFVNVAVAHEAQRDPKFNDLNLVVSAHGFDTSLIADLLDSPAKEKNSRPNVRLPKPIRLKKLIRKQEDNVFSPEFYMYLYPDITKIEMDPLYHFRAHGQAEGRMGVLPGMASLTELSKNINGRQSVLLVSHDGTRTGCPILSLNIARLLSEKYNVLAIFLGPGPMLREFREAGIAVVGPVSLGAEPQTAYNLMKYIHNAIDINFAIVNSVESRAILEPLARLFIPTLSLVHEFSAYTRSSTAFRDAARWAGETVFSAAITRDDAIRSWPVLAARTYPILPQGRCLPAQVRLRPGSLKAIEIESARVRRVLRPEGFAKNGVVIVGIGTVQIRKGVDLFLDCAAKVLASGSTVPCRFIWIGHGYRPNEDFEYSAYLADQVKRAGMEDDVAFLGETTEVREVYRLADVLLLTSRLDPLPNVAIEAMGDGVPVLCFDRTTGIADVLTDEGLGSDLVASYVDVEDMTDKLIKLISIPDNRNSLAIRVREIVDAKFDMATYVSSLEHLIGGVAKKVQQERLDVETITTHRDLIRLDYYIAPKQTEKRMDRLIREYVRAWASEIDMRKLAPGFHPGVYLDRHGVEDGADPFADFLRQGRPQGPWSYPVITSRDRPNPTPRETRVGLHIHAYYPDLFPELLERLKRNKVRPDLLISITDIEHETQLRRLLRWYPSKCVIRLTPNLGRDIGPFLTEFRYELTHDYDIIGHVHTKKTADIKDAAVGRTWFRFLMENLLAGATPMADVILGRMAEQPELGLVFADDPHVVGWDANRRFVEPYLEKLSIDRLPKYMHVPVGTMFWARPQALERLFALELGWESYPREPLPYDGSLLHGLERLFGIVTENAGYRVAGVNCPGVTR